MLFRKIRHIACKPAAYIAIAAGTMTLCASCGGRSFTRQLDMADSLAAVNAPLATEQLERIKDPVKYSCKEEQMRWKLLKVKADVYSFKKFTSDSIIRQVVEYYENHNADISTKTQAYYYAGKVYQSMNDMPQATDYYMKVLDIIPENEINLRGRTYNQLGYIYASLWIDGKAIDMYMKADSCYLASQDTASCIITD